MYHFITSPWGPPSLGLSEVKTLLLQSILSGTKGTVPIPCPQQLMSLPEDIVTVIPRTGGKCHFPLQPSKSRYFLLAHAGFSPFFISLHFNGSEVTQLISYFETSNYMFGSSLFSCTHELVLKDHTFSSILCCPG